MNLKQNSKFGSTSGSFASELFRDFTNGQSSGDAGSTGLRPKERSLLVLNEVVIEREGVANYSLINRSNARSIANPDANPSSTSRPSAVSRVALPDVQVVPEPVKSGDRFRLLQKLEAVVVERLEDSFIARFEDKSRGGIEEEAEIAFDEVSENDLPLIQPGAVFYWSIGYERKQFGQVTRVSLMRFRRLPPLTGEEIKGASNSASLLNASLKRTIESNAAIA